MILSEAETVQLVEKARLHDRSAWDCLLKHFQMALFAYCSELLSSRDDALDAVQQCFIKAVKYLPSLRENTKFSSWLYGIARQECFDTLRRRGRQQKALRIFPVAVYPSSSHTCPLETATKAEDAQQVINYLRQLESDLREPVTLYYLEDFSVAQIADVMQLPQGTVKSRLHRARQILKTKMEEANEPA